MKSVIFTILFTILVADSAIAVLTCLGTGEVIIYNRYADGVTVKVIPVGSIFSGVPDSWCIGNGLNRKYSLRPNCRPSNTGTNWVHVVGGSRAMNLWTLPPEQYDCAIGGYTVYDWDDGQNYVGS